MPCKDSSSRVTVKLDHADRLLDFDFSKITCSKEIGGGTGYREHCLGKTIEEISTFDFNSLISVFALEDPEDQFFLYLEWDALRTAIAQYLGHDAEIDTERYQLASIAHAPDGVEICQVIRPVESLPKITSCFKRTSQSQNQSG